MDVSRPNIIADMIYNSEQHVTTFINLFLYAWKWYYVIPWIAFNKLVNFFFTYEDYSNVFDNQVQSWHIIKCNSWKCGEHDLTVNVLNKPKRSRPKYCSTSVHWYQHYHFWYQSIYAHSLTAIIHMCWWVGVASIMAISAVVSCCGLMATRLPQQTRAKLVFTFWKMFENKTICSLKLSQWVYTEIKVTQEYTVSKQKVLPGISDSS